MAAAGCDGGAWIAEARADGTPPRSHSARKEAAGDEQAAAVRLPLQLRLDPHGFKHELGHAWIVTLPPEWAAFSSDVNNPDKSTLQLTEDGAPLGPGNAAHAEIREDGKGAYSHWLTALYFSASDNSAAARRRRAGRELALSSSLVAAGTIATKLPPSRRSP